MTAAEEVMSSSFGYDVLHPFDVWEDAKDFLAEVIEARAAPRQELQALVEESLLAGSNDWHYWIDCATSIQAAERLSPLDIGSSDVLEYLSRIAEATDPDVSDTPWAETDKLIAQAKALEHDAETHLSVLRAATRARALQFPTSSARRSQRRVTQGRTSHYWDNNPAGEQLPNVDRSMLDAACELGPPHESCHVPPRAQPRPNNLADATLRNTNANKSNDLYDLNKHIHAVNNKETSVATGSPAALCVPVVSPYFQSDGTRSTRPSTQRPLPGIVSSIPFPSLLAPCFGIIQEKLAHEPFWLLIAVTFLIKTRGSQAIPVFYKVRERFPTPTHLANPAIEGELLGMIHHLGLSVNRVAYIQKYARLFLQSPPRAGVKYKVKAAGRNKSSFSVAYTERTSENNHLPLEGLKEDAEAWEIGHMTSGKYAIDSWRIFCRDELLGLAQDWNGKGREPEFQPEWMRVMPDDKELRAYLRWMWMREGWDWDPITGERAVLRAEMQTAVNEGRVGYDNMGGLQILNGTE